jgi:hypothetical protein
MEADFRGEIVIVEKKWPASLFAAAKGCKSVRRHAKCNVSRIIEKLIEAALLIDSNIFLAELSIIFAVHDILDLAGFMVKISSIA